MCVEMVVIPFFTLFGVFIPRMTLWREINVSEETSYRFESADKNVP